MDALKKAEEEKKRAAKRLEQVEATARTEIAADDDSNVDNEVDKDQVRSDQLTETMKLSLEPLDVSGDSPSVSQEETVTTVEVTNDDKENTRELSLDDTGISEDLTLESPIAEEAFEQTQEAIDLNDTTIIEGLSTENVSAPFDDTFHGVLFEDKQGTDVYEETLPGVPADQLAKDLGGGEFQPTPVAAQTVFSAGKGGPQQRSSFTWGIIVVLVLLATGAFSVFYYFTITPVSRSLPSPEVARGIEFTPAPLPAITPITESEVVSGTIISPEIEEPQLVAVADEMEEQAVSSEITTDLDDINLTDIADSGNEGENVINETGKENNIPEVDKTLSAVKPVQDEISLEEITRLPPENIQADSSLISISKSKAPKQENVMVSQAFKAYEGGHYDAAKSIYQDVIKTEPDNRDAHLGLAAIAINEEDRESAYYHYIRLLELNPADTLALNALIGLSNSTDPVADESAIKVLIQQEGDLPYLYFSLGNLYAKQLRWADAQQAFFDAYRLDTINPDYVLNLAISLDQIGQYDTALDFYKTAIDLSQNSYARFDFTSVNNRIFALSKIIESKL